MALQKSVCLFCCLLIVNFLSAQNISGYEIPVSQRLTTALSFNASVTDFRITERNSPYALSRLDAKSIKIETLHQTNTPYNLIVIEGGRKHEFILVYKEDVDFSKQVQDFSNLNIVKQIADSLQHNKDMPTQDVQLQRNEFDSLINVGDAALADSDYITALDNYKRAHEIKQLDTAYYYINQQISYLEKEIPIRDSINKQRKLEAEHQRNVEYAVSIYKQAQDSVRFGNFEFASLYFKQFINFIDSLHLTSDQYDFDKMINYANTKVNAIQIHIDTINAKKLRGDTLTPKLPAAINRPDITLIYYPNPKDPGLDTIYKKYPAINFNIPPDNQLFDSIDLSQETKLKSKDIMSATPSAIATTDYNGIRLVCNNIIFKNNKVYFKCMLYNFSSDEYLTGTMLITQRQAGNSVGILPVYISAYPIILPGEQKVIVYVTKDKVIADDSNLEFEISDRLNKNKIKITIPASVYNTQQQKAHH